MLSFGKKKIFALDIGSYSIKLIELNSSKKGYQLANMASVPLPPEAIVDGALMDTGAIVDAIRNLISSAGVKGGDVAVSVSGHSVIIKKISLPAMTENELADSIQWEAEQYIPFDIADVNLDFQILGPNAVDQTQIDVLLVAAKKEIIDDYTAVIAEAGLNAVVIDIDAFAAQNMVEINYPAEEGEVVATVNVGAELSNINIVKDGVSLFTRDVANGGNQFTEEIQKRFGVSYENADAAKLGGEVEGVDADEVKEVLQEVSGLLSSEIARTIDFFMATNPEDSVRKAYICGGGAKTEGLDKSLADKLGVPVEVVNPFSAISYNEKNFDPEYLDDVAPSFGVAVGLAIRREGD
ncbi:MAG: type IV pilus assembly protein PilM [Proteobacteria bacterium]|nr:type IV pilus assembly protein PilM [Pseudomonadota bacterium]